MTCFHVSVHVLFFKCIFFRNSGPSGGSQIRGVVRTGEHLEEIVGDTPETGPFSLSFLSTGASAENVLKYNYLTSFVPSPEVWSIE